MNTEADAGQLGATSRFHSPTFAAACLATGLMGIVCANMVRGARVPPRGSLTHDREILEPIRLEPGIVGRSRVILPIGDCIVVHNPIEFLSGQEEAEYLVGDPETTDDDLAIYQEAPGSPWRVADDNHSEWTTFNCAAYAIGDCIGLSRSDWLEASAVSWTQGQSPADAVLRNFYDLVARFDGNEQGWVTAERSPAISDGDVIAWVDENAGFRHRHFGRARRHRDRVEVVSKLGVGPLVCGSIGSTSRRYEGKFTEIQVYRLRRDGLAFDPAVIRHR